MKPTYKLISIIALLAILSFAIATPVLAFDGREGADVVIKADEVVEDDVYVAANTFTLDGTIKGDLVVVAETVTINGTVEGDLIAAAQTVVINGTVTDDARIAGAALQLGESAVIGDDLVAGGGSLETKDGSSVAGDLALGAGQTLLAGKIDGKTLIGAGSAELRGEFGGDVIAEVGERDQSGPAPTMYMREAPISIPSVPSGLTISKSAKIAGKLEYTQMKDIKIPAGVVVGNVIRNTPVIGPEAVKVQPTSSQRIATWAFNMIRSMLTLILFGLLLGWLLPIFMKALPEKLKAQPLASFGWGMLTFAMFFVVLLVIPLVVVLGSMLFGMLTLGGVVGTIIVVGIIAFFALIVLFVLVASYLTKIVFGEMIGKLILNASAPTLAEHKFWPMIIGVIVTVFVVELFRFPLLPFDVLGNLINFAVILFGLGALWIWGREKFAKKPVVQTLP